MIFSAFSGGGGAFLGKDKLAKLREAAAARQAQAPGATKPDKKKGGIFGNVRELIERKKAEQAAREGGLGEPEPPPSDPSGNAAAARGAGERARKRGRGGGALMVLGRGGAPTPTAKLNRRTLLGY